MQRSHTRVAGERGRERGLCIIDSSATLGGPLESFAE